MPLLLLGLVLLFVGGGLGIPWTARFAFFLIVFLVAIRAGTVHHRDPVPVQAPIRGRWRALNSPASKVPSHGIQSYGQTYAIDIVHEPGDGERPSFRFWPLARRAIDFPGFGEPVLAATDGTVVRIHDRERDHWSRSSWPALLFVFFEGVLREVTGPGRILGNHVVVQVTESTYAVYAHLQRGSLQVSEGQRITAGDHIANCGNSGQSTEPHLHFQLMDHRSVLVAAGLPFRFVHYQVDGDVRSGVPANNQAFEVS